MRRNILKKGNWNVNIIERSATLGHQYRFLVSNWLGTGNDGVVCCDIFNQIKVGHIDQLVVVEFERLPEVYNTVVGALGKQGITEDRIKVEKFPVLIRSNNTVL